jgi:hypothetical protein
MTHALKIKMNQTKMIILAMITAVALGGLAAECQSQGGWSQEGGDSEPRWRN